MDLPIKINYYAISTLGEQGTLVAFGLHFISLIKRTRKAQNSHLLPIATPPPLLTRFLPLSTGRGKILEMK